jgi:hypothetical protein
MKPFPRETNISYQWWKYDKEILQVHVLRIPEFWSKNIGQHLKRRRVSMVSSTLPLQWFLAPTRLRLRVSTTATTAQIPAVSSKEGAVIGTVLSTGKFHRGHH